MAIFHLCEATKVPFAVAHEDPLPCLGNGEVYSIHRGTSAIGLQMAGNIDKNTGHILKIPEKSSSKILSSTLPFTAIMPDIFQSTGRIAR